MGRREWDRTGGTSRDMKSGRSARAVKWRRTRLAHILTECRAPGQTMIWNIVRALFTRKSIPTPEITLGVALGAHVFVVSNEEGVVERAKTRAARLILTEAVHTIWVLRCERVVGWQETPERRHTDPEVVNRFAAKLNARVQMDQEATNVRRHKARVLSPNKVISTWQGILKDEHNLPADWLKHTGVLVGIPPLEELREAG